MRTDGSPHPEIVNAPGFTVEAEIAVQRGAVSGIAVSPDGTRLMVTHYGDDSVSLIDTGDGEVAQTVVDIDEPFAVAVSDTPQRRAYVSTVSAAYDSILAFDMDDNRVVAAHPVAHSVTDLAVSPDGRHVYASRTAVNGADVAILDTRRARKTPSASRLPPEPPPSACASAPTAAGCMSRPTDHSRQNSS